MIEEFFTTLFTITRPIWKIDNLNNSYSEEEVITTFSGHIQQASAELAQNLALSFSKTYSVWCPVSTNILEGDTITTTTQIFSVRAIIDNAIGDNKHKQLVVQLESYQGS